MENTNTQPMINLVKKLFTEVFTKGNISVSDELVDTNVKLHDPATRNGHGLASFKDTENTYKRAFPTKKLTIEDIFAAGDKVIVRWTCQATQSGPLQDISASNKKINISGISVYRISNNKIVEIWQSWDRLGLLEQIGEIQPALALH